VRISVVIATFNRKHSLAECLRTLVDQDFPVEQFEIIVVIDGSNDGTAEMLRSQPFRPKLTIFEQNNSGQAGARNAGVDLSGGDIILFLDDDMQCERNLLSAHWEAHKANASAVVCGEIRPVLSSSPTPAEVSLHEDLSRYYAVLKERGHPVWPENAWIGPNCSMPRHVFAANGGFDEASFPRRWEDVDFGIRLWKAGTLFRYAPDAVVSHRFIKSVRQSSVDAQEDGASIVRLSRKHPESRAGSAIYAALAAPLWKRLTMRVLSSTRLLHSAGLGSLRIALDRVTWPSNILRFRNRLSGFQHLVILLAGARTVNFPVENSLDASQRI
jgi:GT2 family glycosyltransferase